MPHARLSPSDAVRWANCPGAVTFTQDMPDSGASEHGQWGICAHWGLEKALITQQSPMEFMGQTLFLMPDDTVEIGEESDAEE